MAYTDMYNRRRYVDMYQRHTDRLPIVVTVTPPHIAHVRTFAAIIMTVVLAIADIAS